MTGTIVNIQHYAVHDGPGIRTLIFMKGCPLRCPWCCNPESQDPRPQLRYIGFRCRMCLQCVVNCPSSSVSQNNGKIIRSFEMCSQCHSRVCVEKCNYEAVSVSGREITSDELVETIALDIPFYRNSGGGATFSGGEPLMQPSFLLDVLRKCKLREINTAIETCGWAERKTLKDILPYTDLFLFDLKIVDPELHLSMTGKPAGPILGNLAYLAAEKAEIIIRLPLVPGITDTDRNIEDIAQLMTKNNLNRICLEPYHTLGIEKYKEHGLKYRLEDTIQYNPQQISYFSEFFSLRGFQCTIT